VPTARRDNSDAVALKFGQNLRQCRRLVDLSQEELAARASLHRTEIGRLEKGERLPRVDTLIRLAGAMGIPPENLIVGIYWTPGEPKNGGFSFGTSRRAGAD
jgi:transcriptional regulator with XRE-family HTH domain